MRPGVYVTEEPLPRIAPIAQSSGTYGAFIGTAIMGPQRPALLRSWNDYLATFGGFSATKTLPLALYQYFSNGGGPAWVARVLGDNATTSEETLTIGTTPKDYLTFTASSPGVWGDFISVDITVGSTGLPGRSGPATGTFNLEVLQDVRGKPVVVERFRDLSMNPDSGRYVEKVINSTTIGSQFITVNDDTDGTVTELPEGTTDPLQLTGGSDGDATVSDTTYTEAVDTYAEIDAMLVFNLPGVSNVNPVLAAIEARGDSVLIVDTEPDLPPTDPSLPTALTSSYTAVYYPWLYIPDPAPDAPRGSTVKVPPGASVAGMILRTDSTRGVFKAPAGIGAVLANAVANERRLTNKELDDLAVQNINVVRPVPGVGIAAMGARTKSSDTAQFLSVRRTLNYVKHRAARVSKFAMFEPNTPDLWEQVRVVNGAFLSDLWQKGGLAGNNQNQAYYVRCDEEINTPQTIMNGELHIEIGISPTFPAEFIKIRVGQFEADASVIVIEEV